MAKIKIKMPDELLTKLSRLGSMSDTVAEKTLTAGGEVVLSKVQSALNASVGKGTKYKSRSTGELQNALGLTSVKVDRSGNHNIKVGFAEPRHDGISNAKLANILEYGKHGQPPKPFLKPAKRAARSECLKVMEETLKREVESL